MNSAEMPKSRTTLQSVITALLLLNNIFYIIFAFIIYYYALSEIIVCICILTTVIIAITTGVYYKNVVPRYARAAVYISAPIQLLAGFMTVFMSTRLESYLISHLPSYYSDRTAFIFVAAILSVALTAAALHGFIKNAMSKKIGTVIKKIFLIFLTAIFLLANLYLILLFLQNLSIVRKIINISDTLDAYITTDAMIAPMVILPVSEVLAAVLIAIFYRKNMPLFSRIAAYAAAPVQLIALRVLWAVQDHIRDTLPTGSFTWDAPGYKAYTAICAIVFTAVSVLIIIGTVKMLAKRNDKSADTPAPVTA